LIRINSYIKEIAIVDGHDGIGPVFSRMDPQRPIPCELSTLSDRRVQSLAASGTEASRSLRMLVGDTRLITNGDLDGLIVTVTYKRRSKPITEHLVAVQSVEDPDAGVTGQHIIELLCKPQAAAPNVIDSEGA